MSYRMRPAAATGTRPASRHWRVTGWLLAAVWLFFLNIPLLTALHQPERAGGGWWARRPWCCSFGVGATGAACRSSGRRPGWQAHRCDPGWPRLGGLALLLALGLAGIPGTGGDWLATLVYVAAAAVFLLPGREALVRGRLLAALTPPVTAALVPGWEAEGTVVFAVLLGLVRHVRGDPAGPAQQPSSRPPSRRSAGWRSPRSGRVPPGTCTTSSATR